MQLLESHVDLWMVRQDQIHPLQNLPIQATGIFQLGDELQNQGCQALDCHCSDLGSEAAGADLLESLDAGLSLVVSQDPEEACQTQTLSIHLDMTFRTQSSP